MDGIKDIISTIVRGCAQGGIVVPDVLAAFVARTIVESSTDCFSLDKTLTSEAKDEVIIQSIERLLEKDSPQLETMKMQVDFDCSFLEQDNDFQKVIRVRKKMVAAARADIAEMQMGDANDFDSLTALYRKIFRFLMEFAPSSSEAAAGGGGAGGQDRAVEKEVAAALESVFPRIGLKAFVQLTYEEKTAQLMELARIVFGIRLFNRHQGRGGAGIDDMDEQCTKLAKVVERDLSKEVEYVSNMCNKYQEVIVKAYLKIRRNKLRKERAAEKALLAAKKAREMEENEEDPLSESKGGDGGAEIKEMGDEMEEEKEEEEEEELTDWVLERWSFELANRRQYLAFLKSLQEEVLACSSKIAELGETIRDELENLSGLVGGRASVAKEMVYPRFDALASTWITLWEEYILLKVRNNTYVSLRKFKTSFTCSLTEQVYQELLGGMRTEQEQQGGVELGPDVSLAAGASGMYDSFDDDLDFLNEADEKDYMSSGVNSRRDSEASAKGQEDDQKLSEEEREREREKEREVAEAKEAADAKAKRERESKARRTSVQLDDVSPQGAALLQAHNTPDFMLLPLELQGFCPWTMVHASGLLVPGKPALGVIRFDNMYYVCEHKTAIKAFMEAPQQHVARIKEQAVRNPEFIHLLRLQNYFPTASIARLIEKPEFDKGGPSHRTTKEAGTETPTHFVERHIDPNYHWNEWELRRRVLKVVNLKNCSTVSAQTDKSHYRRDGESQVYLPRVKGTQTRRDQGTNPVIRTTYLAGLRGQGELQGGAEAKDVSRYIKPGADAKSDRNKARVVTLTLER